MSLLTFLDKIPKRFNNPKYYTTLSIILKLSSTENFGPKLLEENPYNYKFQNLPVISGNTVDYVICFCLKMIEKKKDE